MAVVEIDIHKRSLFAGGVSFGDVGAYERLDGTLRIAVLPEDPHNRLIVDLDGAARDSDGRVSFPAGFTLLQPTEAGRSNRRLLVDVPNRGRRGLRFFNRAPSAPVPTEAIDPGDGFLMRRGWSVAWVGWQWDVPPNPALIGLEAPETLGPDGLPLAGQIMCEFQTSRLEWDHLLSNRGHLPYPAADSEGAGAVLFVRDWPDAPRSVIPREEWRFARMDDGEVVEDPCWIWTKDGFEPGRIYEIIYTTRRSPVVGAGLVAFRDASAFFRSGAGPLNSPCNPRPGYVYATGASQSGRFLRHLLYLGLNVDESDRPVFDGMHIHIAGARRGEFNQRFGQPSANSTPSFGHLPPFSYRELLSRQRALGGVPLLIATNSSQEYWRGDCALLHVDPDNGNDLEQPATVRVYHFAGTQHTSGSVPPSGVTAWGDTGANLGNVIDYSLLTRAALINLDSWVTTGTEPPVSAYPRLVDGTAIRRETVIEAIAAIPGVHTPIEQRLAVPWKLDLGPDAGQGVGRFPAQQETAMPAYVAAVDADGNEVGGIRSPDVAVPLATYTGWNPRDPTTGGEGQIVALDGSTFPFATTASERQAANDPRPAIFERYRGRNEYLAQVEAAAKALVMRRQLLLEDVEAAVELAAQRFDWLIAAAPGSTSAGVR